jgi:hypothetical protein
MPCAWRRARSGVNFIVKLFTLDQIAAKVRAVLDG